LKILAIANAGGHFIQLLRLTPAFDGHEVAYMSSIANFKDLVSSNKFYFIPDANRSSKLKLISGFFKVLKVVLKYKPDVIVTTGAALGLSGIVAGKFCKTKTIWIDSIANAEEISLSGKLASKVADRTYTQWPDLANSTFMFEGNIIS
jgi:UDP-N-acetylglucosamine:LPS N-acetylglucosamine transferase